VERLWANIQHDDFAFDDLTRGRPDFFLAHLMMPGSQHFEIADVGYACATGIQRPINAYVHFALWRSLSPNDIRSVGRDLLRYLFENYGLYRVTALAPEGNRHAARMAGLLHFRFEGDMRGAFLNKGRYRNLAIYGLLRSEFKRSEDSCPQPQQPQSSPLESEPVAR
jgi:hypothetical protein